MDIDSARTLNYSATEINLYSFVTNRTKTIVLIAKSDGWTKKVQDME